MALSDALPDRPLTDREIDRLNQSEAIDGAVPVLKESRSLLIVCVLLYVGDEQINLGWDPDAEEWGVVNRQPREDSD